MRAFIVTCGEPCQPEPCEIKIMANGPRLAKRAAETAESICNPAKAKVKEVEADGQARIVPDAE